MTNLDQSFDASKIMGQISKAAPLLLLFCALSSFFAFGIFAVDYYEKLFSKFGSYARPLGVVIASITELVRFALLVSSIRDFSDSKKFNGWIGLLGSLALVLHDVSVARSIANFWDAANPTPYTSIFIFLILLGLGLEIRLILTVDLKKDISRERKEVSNSQKEVSKKKKKVSENGKKFRESSNGVHTVNGN